MATLFHLPMRYRQSRAAALKFAVRRAAASVAARVYLTGLSLVRRVQVAWLTWKIDSNTRYIAECSVDGLDKSLAISRFCAEIDAWTVQRMVLRRDF